ncbi:MAG: hypothetical protein WBC70_03530 [Candidatus Aminicenantales bacterium]
MKDELSDHEFEGISALIRKEEEAALAFFRTRNFRGRLESRLKPAAGNAMRPSRSLAWAVPVLATVLVAIVAGTYFLLTRHPVAEPAREFKTLASALAQLPGFSPSPGRERTPPPEKTGSFLVAETVRQVLVKAEQTKQEKEQSVSVPAGTGEVPRLSPDQRMEILFKERAIERALLLFKNDSKEV